MSRPVTKSGAPSPTQINVATAENKIVAARALASQVIDLLQRRADAGEHPTPEERATMTFAVKVTVDQKDPALKPGLSADVAFK